MDDDHRDVHRLGDAQQTAHGLRLQKIGPRLRVRGNAHPAGGLLLLDQGVDNAAVFAVDAADAALFLQLFQGLVHGLIADHHGRVGHVHLKGGNALGIHIVDLFFNRRIPVVNGHVEAVVAPAVAVGLLVPKVQAVAEGLALVGAGEVHDGGGAAPDGGLGAAVEVVDGGGVAHIQVKVGVGVDKAGQEKLPGYIRHPGQGVPEAAAHLQNLLVLHQHIRPAGAPSGHHCAPAKQIFHGKCPPFPG